MRKLLDKDASKNEFSLICFYADWVVHSFLDWNAVAKQQLRDIEKIFMGVQSADIDVIKEVYPFVSFSKLKDELDIFFSKYGFPKNILGDSQWHDFLDSLINILSDSPLIMRDKDSLIKEFVFKPQDDKGDVIFQIVLNNSLRFNQVTNLTFLDNI